MENRNALLPLNLQFFAEEAAPATEEAQAQDAAQGGQPEESTTAAERPAVGKPAANKPVEEDLGKLLAKNGNLLKQFNQRTEKLVADALAKKEREANLTAEELAEARAQEMTRELAEREKAVTARELRAKALGALGEKGLPAELVDAIACTDEEGLNAHLDKVEKAFRAAVDKAVTAKLAGTPPSASKGQGVADVYQQKLDKYKRGT